MNRQKGIFLVLALLLIAAAASALLYLRSHQRLGAPGVKTRPIAGNAIKSEVLLPEQVLDYTSTNTEQPEVVVGNLPPDTSFGSRLYLAPDGFAVQTGIVLMGSDRTSHHKPQYCLPGNGWHIDQTTRDQIHIDRPAPYELPVTKILVTRQYEKDGQTFTVRGVFVYWFVADGALSGDPSGFEKMWSLAKTLVTSGVLQRWAYVTYFAPCAPGQEQATFERVTKLIAASVPEFQLTSGTAKNLATR